MCVCFDLENPHDSWTFILTQFCLLNFTLAMPALVTFV